MAGKALKLCRESDDTGANGDMLNGRQGIETQVLVLDCDVTACVDMLNGRQGIETFSDRQRTKRKELSVDMLNGRQGIETRTIRVCQPSLQYVDMLNGRQGIETGFATVADSGGTAR